MGSGNDSIKAAREKEIERKIKVRIQLLRHELPEVHVDLILEFLEVGRTEENLSASRRIWYLSLLKKLAQILGSTFPEPSKSDVKAALEVIESRGLADWTKTNYRTALKRFYKWRLGGNGEYPPAVSWIRTRRGDSGKLPDDLLTRDEIRRLVEACQNPRDRALISAAADSGCRVGELLGMRIKDVSFDDYGAVFRVTGKTGDRRVRVIGNSIAHLSAWLEVHPNRSNREGALWVGIGFGTEGTPLQYAAARKALRAAVKRAGIQKRVHFHLFRHTRATELAGKVPEAPLEDQMGWTHGGGMTKQYVHLSGRDTDRAILKAAGIEIPEDEGVQPQPPKICARCEAVNIPDSQFCRRCRLPLTQDAIDQVEKDATQSMDLDDVSKLLKDPKVQEFLAKISGSSAT